MDLFYCVEVGLVSEVAPFLRVDKDLLAEDLQFFVFVVFVKFDEVRERFVLATALLEILSNVRLEFLLQDRQSIGLCWAVIGKCHIDEYGPGRL